MFAQPDLKTDSPKIQLLPHHQQVLNHFVEVCQDNAQVVAAFLVGSYASGTADPFADEEVEPADMEPLRRQIQYFWHELSHFIVASWGRGQLWWAQGRLGALRTCCFNLTQRRHDLDDGAVGEEGYFKIDSELPIAQLAPLQSTDCPTEPAAMLQAAHIILRFYQDVARPLAQTYNIPYPADLDRVMVARLAKLKQEGVA